MEQLEQRVIEGLRTLPPNGQQEVLDFVEFLQTKLPSKNSSQTSQVTPSANRSGTRDWIGSLDGPEDLSTNPKYMDGFGQS